jgi:ERCC4-type nuclease
MTGPRQLELPAPARVRAGEGRRPLAAHGRAIEAGYSTTWSGEGAPLVIDVDTRERYGYRFANRAVERRRTALTAGDYAVRRGPDVIAAVERKTLENFATSLVDGSLGLQMAELGGLPAAAVIVEDRYSSLFRLEHVQPGWAAELTARAQVRYPGVPIVFVESRKLAEEWTYRFLAAAMADLAPEPWPGVPLPSSPTGA